jgi:hypothetical protein
MIRMQLVTVVAVGLVATGCSYTSNTREVMVPSRPAPVSTTVVYAPPEPAPPAYVPPVPPRPPVGVQAFRDEYGFRYDGQGNRLDARGNIISPHSTTP